MAQVCIKWNCVDLRQIHNTPTCHDVVGYRLLYDLLSTQPTTYRSSGVWVFGASISSPSWYVGSGLRCRGGLAQLCVSWVWLHTLKTTTTTRSSSVTIQTRTSSGLSSTWVGPSRWLRSLRKYMENRNVESIFANLTDHFPNFCVMNTCCR